MSWSFSGDLPAKALIASVTAFWSISCILSLAGLMCMLLVHRAGRWRPGTALTLSRRYSLPLVPTPTFHSLICRPADAPCRAPPQALPRRSPRRSPQVKATQIHNPPLM
jgi:hypothetical protein